MSAVSLHQILTHLTRTNPQATLQHCSFDSFAQFFLGIGDSFGCRLVVGSCSTHRTYIQNCSWLRFRLHGSIIVPSHRKSGVTSLFKFATSNQLETVLLSQFPNLHKRPNALLFGASNRRFTLSKQTWRWTLHLFDCVYSLLNGVYSFLNDGDL